jgi:uncharacterized protein YbjT (DUF2867 family)
MKIVILGGSGLIGKKLGARLREGGHTVVAASPSSGVNALTGEGLAEALQGAQVVVDVSNSPSFEAAAVLNFFQTSTRNLLAEASAAGVGHLVALSVVGADRSPDSGYLRAKVAQESAIQAGAIPYTIIRATQFFEFIGSIADAYTDGDVVRVSPVLMQPIAADDVAAALADVAVSAPANQVLDLAGPEPLRLDELVRRLFIAKQDARRTTTDVNADYFGAKVDDQSLRPIGSSLTGPTHFADWLNSTK